MIEAVGMQTTRGIETSKHNNVNKICGKVEKTGKQFLEKKYTFVNHFNNWRVVRNGSDISFSKQGDKQHLKIHYEKPKSDKKSERIMAGLDFILSDGKTKISLQKGEDGSWKIIREKDGHKIEGGIILRKDEQRELSNFLYKFKRDSLLEGIVGGAKKISKNVNKILDKVDPDNIYRYVVPTAAAIVGMATGGFQVNTNQISQASWEAAFLGPAPISQKENDSQAEKKHPLMLSSENALVKNIFTTPKDKISEDITCIDIDCLTRFRFARPEDGRLQMNALSLIQNLNLASRFFLNPQVNNGQDLSILMDKYLKHDQDANYLYKWRKYKNGAPTNELVDPLTEVINEIRYKGLPKDQQTFFRFLNALQNYSNPHSNFVTPEKVMQQIGMQTAYGNVTGIDLYNYYWQVNQQNPELFTNGNIKGFSVIAETTLSNDLLVTPDGSIQMVVSIINNKNGVLEIHTIEYVSGGKMIKRVFDSTNFPPNAISFR